MKGRAFCLLAALAACSLSWAQQPAAPAAPGTAPVPLTNAREQMLNLLQQIKQAALTNNSNWFERALAPDYDALNARGEHENRDFVIRAHLDNSVRYESVALRGTPDIRMIGNPDAPLGVEHDLFDVRGVYRGQRFDGTYRATRVWRYLPNGNWQIVTTVIERTP